MKGRPNPSSASLWGEGARRGAPSRGPTSRAWGHRNRNRYRDRDRHRSERSGTRSRTRGCEWNSSTRNWMRGRRVRVRERERERERERGAIKPTSRVQTTRDRSRLITTLAIRLLLVPTCLANMARHGSAPQRGSPMPARGNAPGIPAAGPRSPEGAA